MRVISGKARGLNLKSIENDSTRPTKDMVKEALFSILGERVVDSVFLDLFAGSGAIGIEAISRGAKKAYFSDLNKNCVDVINQNVEKAKFGDYAVVKHGDYLDVLKKLSNEKFDIIYIDPPYSKGMGIIAIQKIAESNMLVDDGILIYETDEIEELPNEINGYEKFNYKKYGRNILNFYGRKG